MAASTSTACSSSSACAADMARELGEDARDLVTLVALELAQPVGQLDDRERLDEQRLPGVARVVDDPRHGAARARAHGDHRATAALGDEVLLQVRLEVGIRGEGAQPVAGPAPRGRELGAQRLELGRGGVLDARRVELQRAFQHIHDRRERLCDLGRALGQQRRRLGALGQMPAHTERRTRSLGDRDERVDPERAASARVIGLVAHVMCPRHVRRPERQEALRLGAQGLPQADLVSLRRWQQRLGERAAGREGRVVGKPLANRGELEHVERMTVHRIAG